MKRMILAVTTLALAGTSVQTVSAGGCGRGHGGGWCAAAAVVGGVTAGLVVGQALASPPAYYVAPAPVCYPAPVGACYYAPAAPPAVVYAAPAPVVYAAPAPVVVYRPPVCVARPVVRCGVGYYGGCRPYGYRGCRW